MSQLNALSAAPAGLSASAPQESSIPPTACSDAARRWRLAGGASTILQYAAALVRFEAFCRANRFITQPAAPHAVASYLRYRRDVDNVQQASLDADARAIRQGHLACGLPDPTNDPAVREALGRRRPIRGTLPALLFSTPVAAQISRALERAAPDLRVPVFASSELSLDELDPIVERFRLQSLSRGTRRAYAHALREYVTFCDRHDLCALPAEAETVCRFLADYGLSRKPPSLGIARAAIRWVHRRASLPSPTDHPYVAEVVEGHARMVGTKPTQKYALTTSDIVAMCCAMDAEGGILAIRDRAMMLLGFAGAFRRSEITSRDEYEDGDETVCLAISDLVFDRFGVTIVLRKSKTDQAGAGADVRVVYGLKKETCAVLALQCWLELLKQRGIETGPVFRSVYAKGDRLFGDAIIRNRPLTPGCLVDRLKYWAAKIGLDPRTIGGHSLRAGHVTTAAQGGASVFSIAEQGRWKNLSTVQRYYRRATSHVDNSSSVLGL